jgi:hypothetical protein
MPIKSLKPNRLSSESLKTLTREAFLPSFLLLITKLIGLLVLPKILGFDYQIVWQTDGIPFNVVFSTEEQALIVNSYSNLAMYGVIFLGFFWVLIRSYHFHDTHIKPATSAKLAEMRLLHLITDSFEVYHSAFVWFCYMWLAVIVSTIYYLMGLSYLWIFMGTFLSSVLMTYILIDDLEKEFFMWRLFDENNETPA